MSSTRLTFLHHISLSLIIDFIPTCTKAICCAFYYIAMRLLSKLSPAFKAVDNHVELIAAHRGHIYMTKQAETANNPE